MKPPFEHAMSHEPEPEPIVGEHEHVFLRNIIHSDQYILNCIIMPKYVLKQYCV